MTSKLPRELVELYVVSRRLRCTLSIHSHKIRDMLFKPSSTVGVSSSKCSQHLYNVVISLHPSSTLRISRYNNILQVGVLPPTLTDLNLSSFNQPLQVGVLPASLTTLTMNNFDQPFQIGVLPNSLTTLYMYDFDQPLQSWCSPHFPYYTDYE